MASKLKVAEIQSFVDGLNMFANATQVKDSESPDLLNILFTGLTAITKRQGYAKLTTSEVSTGHSIQGIFSYITNSVREILYVSNGTLYKYNSGSSSAISGGSLHASNNVNACQVGDRLYLVDGSSNLSYYDGTNITTTGITAAPSKSKQAIFFNSRIYCTSDDNRDRVYYGDALTDAGDASNTGDFTVDANGGYFGFGMSKEVVGFAKKDDYLYVFLKESIYRIEPVVSSGTLDHTAVLVSNAMGCRSPRSIENVENDIGFMSSTYYFLGEVANFVALRTTNISAKVQALFEGMTQSAIENVAAIYYDKEETLLLAVQVGSDNNDHIIGYQTPYKAWFYWDDIEVNSFLDWTDGSGVRHLYFGSANTSKSYVYELYQGLTDDGSDYDCYYKTKEFDLKKFNIEKIFQNWNIQFGGIYGTITAYFYVNGVLSDTAEFVSGSNVGSSDGFGTEPFGIFPMGIEGNYTEISSSASTINNDWRWHTLTSSPSGTTFQIMFENNNKDESFEIKQASVGYLELPYYKRSPDREV